MNSPLHIDRLSHSWTFLLNRPDKRNALSSELVEALITGVEAAHEQNISTLIFRGIGKNFSAGFDFTGYDTQSEGDLVLRMIRIETLLQLIAGSPALTVAFAHGRNFGAGVDLFAACKLRYCANDAGFRMPGLKFGLLLGTRRFKDLVGTDNALSILGSARGFDAAEGLRIGFVTAIEAEAEWPGMSARAEQTAAGLHPRTRERLYTVLNTDRSDGDLAELVRSASLPGLKERIRQYLAA